MMAQSGLHIPASCESRIPVYQEIFADIGDEQSIEQSLSTFSSHMKNIVHIVEHAGEGALVLLDELGAGTDPTEGAALAIAILETLKSNEACVVATTHYNELKKFAIEKEGVQNASMEFDVETLSPTYRLNIGIPGKSNAFEISGKLGLDKHIIDRANQLIERGDMEFEEVISSIENDKKQAEAEKMGAEFHQSPKG
jgi:DNA mismatch repair protein MutS2